MAKYNFLCNFAQLNSRILIRGSLWRFYRSVSSQLRWLYRCLVSPVSNKVYRSYVGGNGLLETYHIGSGHGRGRLLTILLLILTFSIVILFIWLFHIAITSINSAHKDKEHSNSAINLIRDEEDQKEYIDRHGVHVIVGQYMGKGFPWLVQPNLTNGVLDMNAYSPLLNYGENGQPVYLRPNEQSKARQLYFINRFNLMVSDRISVNRSLPDVRKRTCRNKRYPTIELNTSVIIVFHNEAWSTLVRTVHSVINRSHRSLLCEIILVDDASERIFLKSKLDDYMDKLSNETNMPIHILRSEGRIGLIRARIQGANVAKGKVLTFLDAHCETTNGWLEPLLYRISINRKAVVCPVIDIINDQTFAYTRSFAAHWGAINWELSFRWFSIGAKEMKEMRMPNYDDTQTFPTPFMAGGLFSIEREYFFEMGTYDSHLNIWGGENIEMSLRIWQCGGRIEISPCSHVGHLFRSSSPYNFGDKKVGDVLYANLIRVVEVWLDEWKNFFYRINPAVKRILLDNRTQILEEIDQRKLLRKKLHCKNFKWFLENVWPDHIFPTKDKQFSQIQSQSNKDCLQRPSNGRSPVGKVIMAKCFIEIFGGQMFILPLMGQTGFIRTDESMCLDVSSLSVYSPVILLACSSFDRQKWLIESGSNRIVHVQSKLCLTLDRRGNSLALHKCREKYKMQQWTFENRIWDEPIPEIDD